jgi:hypothetical protein
VFLGDTTRDGVTAVPAWKKYGYNLDGKVTTQASTDVCTPAMGAGLEAQVDGDLGIDNAFGSRIVPILETFSHELSARETATIQSGAYTHLLQLYGLTDDPGQSNVDILGVEVIGAPFGAIPTFTVADDWPMLASSLYDGVNLGTAKLRFPWAYVNRGTWVATTFVDTLIFRIALGSAAPFDVAIHQPIVTFDHVVPNRAANGTIAGVLDTEEFVAELHAIAGRVSTSLCSGSAFDSIAQQIRQASDILKDGTNVHGAACNGISIGIGFEGMEVGSVKRVSPDPPPSPNPCP